MKSIKDIFITIIKMLRNLQRRFFSIDGFGKVLIGKNLEKAVRFLKEGDQVLTPQGEAIITKISKTKTATGYFEMAEFNKMRITGDHLIEIYGEWTPAKDVQKVNFVKCGELYSFELDRHHVLTINGNNISTIEKFRI